MQCLPSSSPNHKAFQNEPLPFPETQAAVKAMGPHGPHLIQIFQRLDRSKSYKILEEIGQMQNQLQMK